MLSPRKVGGVLIREGAYIRINTVNYTERLWILLSCCFILY